LARDEHRHARSVLAAIEHLLGEVLAGIDWQPRRTEGADSPARDVEAEDRGGRQEIRVREEGLAIVGIAEETRRLPEARKLNVVQLAPREVVDLHQRVGILEEL